MQLIASETRLFFSLIFRPSYVSVFVFYVLIIIHTLKSPLPPLLYQYFIAVTTISLSPSLSSHTLYIYSTSTLWLTLARWSPCLNPVLALCRRIRENLFQDVAPHKGGRWASLSLSGYYKYTFICSPSYPSPPSLDLRQLSFFYIITSFSMNELRWFSCVCVLLNALYDKTPISHWHTWINVASYVLHVMII
jgi:hypothetical protein